MAICDDIVAVMVPFPGQSHLNQLLELGALISGHGIPVHFIGTATHNRQVKHRATGLQPEALAKISFHDFPTPPIPSPDPDANAGKMPKHLLPAVIAYGGLCEPVAELVQQLSAKAKRVVVVFDTCNSEAVKGVVSVPKAELFCFYTSPALYYLYILWNALGKPFHVEGDVIASIKQLPMDISAKFMLKNREDFTGREGDIYNTSRALEGQYLDLLEREEISGNKKQFAIRPNLRWKLNTWIKSREKRRECLDWLDKQPPSSVIYVCFGSTIAFSDQEIKELAIGLEESKQKFLWVLLGADKADIFSGEAQRVGLPQGFEERVLQEDIGIVVREWAPQLEILAHGSVGGFMCHCGWNSSFEGLSMGVPMAAWPMHSDQPFVAEFLTKVLGVGLIVREWEEREEVATASTIKRAVERLIASEEGDEMRRRAKEISAAINKEGMEGSEDLQNFIAHITRS